MKYEVEALEVKIEQADKILHFELKDFKQKISDDFSQLVKEFGMYKRDSSQRQTQQWDGYLQRMSDWS